jgi:arabinofuranosyltransferase
MRRALPILAAALTVAAAVFWGSSMRWAAFDDAYITFRAAVNLAHGNGPVFNPGERVESATSPLWTLLLALAEVARIGPVAASPVLALIFAAGAAAFAALIALELGGPLAAALTGVVLAVLPAWSGWICTGMEVALAGCCISAALFAAMRGKATAAGALAAAAALSRPEAIAIYPALLLALPRASWPRFLACALSPLLLLLLARRAYFGEWVPNTYVAKRQGLGFTAVVRGVKYVGLFALANVALVAAVCRAGFRKSSSLALALACAGFALAVAWDGGDHFPLARLLSPVLPIGCAVLGAELVALPRRWLAIPAAVALTFAVPHALHVLDCADGLYELTLQALYTEGARNFLPALRELPEGRIATITIGFIGFETGRNILDLVGLADKHIARTPHFEGGAPGHDHVDVDYVLAQKPAYALFVPQLSDLPISTEDEAAWLLSLDSYLRAARMLQSDPRFRALYEPLDYQTPDNRHLRLWALKR